MSEPGRLVEELFRSESAHLIAALTRLLGPSHLALAEDVVQEALQRAMLAWRLAPPRDPKAWILQTAKRCAIDHIRRSQRESKLVEESLDEALSPDEDAKNQLAMMFSICDDRLSSETHVTLILRFLCGLGPNEIARAFLVDTQTIDRRLHRGRARLRELGALTEPHDDEAVRSRLPSVMQALYLLFNEGYQGNDPDEPMHPAFCTEALRLAELLLDGRATAEPAVHALAATFCFHAARLPTRLDPHGVFRRLSEQDRSRWDRSLIERGVRHLAASASGDSLSRWHLEAGIAAEHAMAPTFEDTNWSRIVRLYEQLAAQVQSPVIAVGHAMAVGELRGVEAGRDALVVLETSKQLTSYPPYWAARGELEARSGRPDIARACYERARGLAHNDGERGAYDRELARLRN
jgi:RNA polymerase sigma factor (sigma-70 family)